MIKTKFYSHSSKSSNFEQGSELKLSDKALENFVYVGYEIIFDVEIDEETGDCWATAINGKVLAERVKI